MNTKRLYDLLYTPIVTPYNLLTNAKLENYEYVNYYKGNNGLIAEMKCKLDTGNYEVFFYHFDQEDFLQEIFIRDINGKALIYSRTEETIKERDKIVLERKKTIQKDAI